MDALSTNGEGDIDAIIDEQRNTMGSGDLMDSSSSADQIGCVRSLVSVLDKGDTLRSGSAQDG